MDKETPEQKNSSLISLAWDMGFIFAVPLVVFALVGRLLDSRLGTSPWLLIVGIVSAAIASSIGVFFKIRKLIQPMNNTEKEDQDKQ